MPNFPELRQTMIDSLLRTGGVTGRELLVAIESVPRELFLPVEKRSLAYMDIDIPLDDAETRYLMNPLSFSRLVQAASISQNDRILVLGAGCGYSTAIFSKLGSSVHGLESNPELLVSAQDCLNSLKISSVSLTLAPLNLPHTTYAPYHIIFVEGAIINNLPSFWSELLADGGRLVVVEGIGLAGQANLYLRSKSHVSNRTLFNCAIPLLSELNTTSSAFIFP